MNEDEEYENNENSFNEEIKYVDGVVPLFRDEDSITYEIRELDRESDEIKNVIGKFNFLIDKNEPDKAVEIYIRSRLHELMLFKDNHQEKINKDFDEIIEKNFSK